jgi:hypothetical protein
MKYFSYNTEDGFQIHTTAEEAKKFAEDALNFERGEAREGWSDYVDQICWGELKQRTIETLNRPRTDDDTYVSSDCETIVNYGLVDV